MDDFLSSRPQINSPRSGQARTRAATAESPLGELRAEVKKPGGEAGGAPAPEVETVVSNGRIRRIHIHCKCGEEIILHCDYPQ